MNCNDCIHYEVCKDCKHVFERKMCDLFQDKSKMIELPCKVGDTKYIVKQKCTERGYYDEKKITNSGDCEDCDCDGMCDVEYFIDEKKFLGIDEIFRFYREYVITDACKYLQKVFLTREEAEQKLKELKNE